MAEADPKLLLNVKEVSILQDSLLGRFFTGLANGGFHL